MDYEFYLNNKGVIDFNKKCLRCSKMCKQSCNIISMICRHYVKQPITIPKEQQIVMFWKYDNPKGSKKRCIEETGLAKTTVYKYWKDALSNAPDVPPVSKKVEQETRNQ